MSTATIQEVRKKAPVPRHEILAAVRGDMERTHRQLIWIYSAWTRFQPCPFEPGSCSQHCHHNVADMSPEHAEDCCNRSVPIYVIPGLKVCQPLLAWVLNTWLYRRWYKPYRNDIEHGQFFAKQFYPCAPLTNTPLVPFINNLHAKICSQVKSYQQHVVTLPLTTEFPGQPRYRDQQFLVLQPLFEAITIIVLQDDFNVADSDLDNLPCLITLTGHDGNLSAPITFSSIKHHITSFVSDTAVRVPLHIAFDFIMSLQQREIDAFGLQPDPIQCHDTKNLGYSREYLNSLVQELGGGDELAKGPSSTWVDTTIYTGPYDGMVSLEKYNAWQIKTFRRVMVRQLLCGNISQSRPNRRNSI